MVLDSHLDDEDNLDKYMTELEGMMMEEAENEMQLPAAPTFQHVVEKAEREEEREAIAELA